MAKTWRQHAAPIIAKVIKDNEGKTEKEIRAALKEAYPYGERAMHPYKIWCDEINKQLKKPSKTILEMEKSKNQFSLF